MIEALEQRLVLDGSPIVLGSDITKQIQIQLDSKNDNWVIQNGIYKTNNGVSIGFKPEGASFISVLSVVNSLDTDGAFGIEIDPSNNKFTIKATQASHNVLAYLPNGQAAKQANLFEFVADYTVLADALVGTAPLTPSAIVLATSPETPIGIKVSNADLLNPSSFQLAKDTVTPFTPQVLLTGTMGISATSKGAGLKTLLSKANLDIGEGSTAVVTADATGLVLLTSQGDDVLYLSFTADEEFTFGPFKVTAKAGQWVIDLKAKTFAIAGQFTIGLKDDSADVTPFLLDFGDSNNPGLVLDFDGGFKVDHVNLAVKAGTNKDGTDRSTINLGGPLGLQLAVDDMLIIYDRATDDVGIAGEVDVTIGEAGDPTKPQSTARIILGNFNNNEAGLFVKDGVVEKFHGELTGTINIRRLTFQIDVTADYAAATMTTVSTASIYGTVKLIVNNPLSKQTISFAAEVAQGLPILYKGGDWEVQNIKLEVQGEIDAPGGLDLSPRGLTIGFADKTDPTTPTQKDFVFTISGSASLPKLWNATIGFNDGNNPGLTISNGNITLDGFQFSIADTSLGGGVGLRALSIDFERLNNGADWDLKIAGKVVLPGGFELDAELELKDGLPISLGVDYKATGQDPGIPLGDTGLFITEAGLQLENLYSAEIIVEGEIGLGYGEPVDGVRVFDASGHFKVDRHEFDILEADVRFLGGTAGYGKAALTLNWTNHEYKLTFDVSLLTGLIDITGLFDLNPFGQITVALDASLRIPSWVPFVGGDTLASLDGLLYYDPIVPNNSLVAAWVDINTFIFGHLRFGAEYVFQGPYGGVHFVTGAAVEALENQSTQNNEGYTTNYTAAISTPANFSTFTVKSDTANVLGSVVLGFPNTTDTVTLTGGSNMPQPITLGGEKFQVVLVLTGANGGGSDPSTNSTTIAWMIRPDPDGNRYAFLPQGNYTATTLTAEVLESTLNHTESFTPPTVTSVTLVQPMNSNAVQVSAVYGTGDPQSTQVELFYTTDPTGATGTSFAKITPTGTDTSGTVTATLDLSPLAVRKDYYVFALITDPTNRTSTAVVSTSHVTPYATVSIQLNITPDVPYDRAADTLIGWPVTWRRTDVAGTPDIRLATDQYGFSGLAFAQGTWTVIVAPANRDGFNPIAGANQTATDNGQLIQAGVTTGTPASPTALTMNFQNMISVHGLVSEDLSGSGKFQPGGAGLSGLTLYNDVNNNGMLDPGERFTTTDLGGYYDLRFPLPAVAQNFIVRIVPDGSVATYFRTMPGSVTDDTYRLADPTSNFYTIAADPQKPDPIEGFAYNGRDLLLQHPIVISGVGYESGSKAEAYGPFANPVGGQKIDLRGLDDSNKTVFLTTNTDESDGSYSFLVPQPGRYLVSTDENDFNLENVPGQHKLGLGTFQNNINFAVPVKTPDGKVTTLYQLGATAEGPIVVTGDFDGDGLSDVATLAVDSSTWSATSPANLYLVIYTGADLPSDVTGKAFLAASAVKNTPANIPSLFWSDALDLFVLPTPDAVNGTIATSIDPETGVTKAVAIPSNAVVPAQGVRTTASPMTSLLAVESSPRTGSEVWLMASATGKEFMLLSFSDFGSAPQVLSQFDFFTGNGIKPDVLRHAGDAGGTIDGRWASLTRGEFDGDGIDDFAFTAASADGSQRVGYVLSSENYNELHTLILGGSYTVAPGQKNTAEVWINSLRSVPPSTTTNIPGAMDSLAVHRSATIGTGASAVMLNEMLVFDSQQISNVQVVDGAQAGSFAFRANFPLQGGYSDDYVADINADGLPDLLTLDDGVLGVILNLGEGDFAAPTYASIQSQIAAGSSGGLLSAGLFPAPVPCDSLPSILYVQHAQAGQPLSLQLVFNQTTFQNGYEFNVQSAGSYGGFHFGFTTDGSTAAQTADATFTGVVFIDENANGKQDPGERNLVGKTVTATTYDLFGDPEVTSYVTGRDGRYSIPGIVPEEVVIAAPGLKPRVTTPNNADNDYDLNTFGGITGFDFGVKYATASTGSLQGLVYIDANASGSYAPGDPAYGGMVVYLDTDGSGTLDPGEKQVTTDDHGAFKFTALTPGTYTVRIDLPTGVTQVSAPPAVSVDAGETTYAANFGVKTSGEAADFNHDGRSDYLRLIRRGDHAVDVALDLMTAGDVGRSYLVGTYDPMSRRVVGVGDFDLDGHLDLLFQDQVGGALRYWSMRDGRAVAEKLLGVLPEGWRAVDVLDVDAKGGADLLIRNRETDALGAWLLNGTSAPVPMPLGLLASNEMIEGAMDADGDGDFDLMIRDARTGSLSARFLQDGHVVGESRIGGLDPHEHLIGINPGPTGHRSDTTMLWQDDRNGSILRWTYRPGAGVVSVDEATPIRRSAAEGQYLTLRDADTALIDPINDRAALPGEVVRFVAIPSPSAEGRSLRYALAPGAPAGATIDPATGAFSWVTPVDATSTDYTFTIIADDPNTPGLTDSRTFSVNVRAIPLLDAISNREIQAGSSVRFTVQRSDAAQGRTIQYSLAPGAPAGASIDATTGEFAWSTPAELPAGTYTIRVQATDLNSAVTDSRTFAVTVTANPVPSTTRFVSAVYLVVLDRPALPDELSGSVGSIVAGGPRGDVAQSVISSPEHRDRQADRLYNAYLHRAPTAAERLTLANFLAGGATEAEATLRLVTSPEYLRAHRRIRAFIAALRADTLGINAGRTGLAAWLKLASRGTSRNALARAFLTSREVLANRVDALYAETLGRRPTTAERTSSVEALRTRRTSLDSLSRSLLASDEFFARANR